VIVAVPRDAMLVLVGPSGAGKSTFAAHAFAPSEVLSSDALRAMVADDPNDQTATEAAFELLHGALGFRLARRRFTVVDATNVEARWRAPLLDIARRHGRRAVAIVFDLPLELCLERNAARSRGPVPEAAVRRQHLGMRRSIEELAREGFEPVVRLSSAAEVQELQLERG
jgi:protein phosphatase